MRRLDTRENILYTIKPYQCMSAKVETHHKEPHPPTDFIATAEDIFAWIKEQEPYQHGYERIEQKFILTRTQQLVEQAACLLGDFTMYNIGESISTPKDSLKKNGISCRIWRGPTEVWSVRIGFTNFNDSIRINAVMAQPGADMTNFIFPREALANDAFGRCQSTHEGLSILHFHDNSSTEIDTLSLQQQLFVDRYGHDFVVWLGVDHGPLHIASPDD